MMKEIQVRATSEELTINGKSWNAAAPTREVCEVLQAGRPVDGHDVVIGKRAVYRFRYFDEIGISILESIGKERVVNIDFFMEVPALLRKKASPYRNVVGERRTTAAFPGVIELNGKQLRSPLNFAQFPLAGDLRFVNRIALSPGLSGFVGVQSRLVERIGFGFKRADDD